MSATPDHVEARPPVSDDGHRRLGVLDLGSTTFQLLVADASADGWLVPVLRDRVVLNLGLVLGGTGSIPAEVGERAGRTARRLRDVARRAGAEEVVAIATSALRESPNREDLERLLDDALDGNVRFIDGREEARLTAAGVRASVALPTEPALLLDLGGGSLEVALADGGGLRWGMSLPIGAGRLTGLLVEHDPPTRDERKAVRRRVEDAIGEVRDRVEGLDVSTAIASGGTAGALARLIAARRWSEIPSSLNQYTVSVDALKEITSDLAGHTLAQRLKMPGIDERRAELLPAGGWILTTAAAALGVSNLVHSEWGLREGVVLDTLGLADAVPDDGAVLRARSVEHLARRETDRRHPDLVADVTERLFETLRPLHGLDTDAGELLRFAAILHEVGTTVSPAKYHKHGAYLIEHGALRGFTPEEVAMLSSIVRFQRGKDPRPVYPPFADLDPDARTAVERLTAILRVAHAIARGDEGDDLSVDVHLERRAIRIDVTGSRHPDGVVDEAADASPLLTRMFDRAVEVRTDGDDGHPAA